MWSYLLAGLVGLAVSSFLNVVISRLPREEPFWAGRSRCPQCRTSLPWYDNIPLFSFFWLQGRCRFCQASIPWWYPGVELAGGGLAVALWAQFPGSPELLAYGPLLAGLLVLTVLDLQYRWLPDVITLPGTALGLVLALVLPHLAFWQAGLGALLGAGLFQGLSWLYTRLTRRPGEKDRQGLGGGDVKLMALIGAFLGVEALPFVIFVSAALGSLVGLVIAWRSGQGRLTPVPYGPFLAGAAVLYIFFGRQLLEMMA